MRVRLAVAVAAISLIAAPVAAADTGTPGTLSVDGSGSVTLTPDRGVALGVRVRVRPRRPRAALSAANRTVDAIVGATRALGVPADGIQTNYVNVYGGTVRVGPRKHQHRVKRFTANESLSITSTASIVGQVIDAATHAGASNVNGPDFSFSNPNAGAVAATDAALVDARQLADAAAAALGYTVTGVQSVNLNPQSSVVVPVAAAPGSSSSSSSGTPTNIHPGTEEVDATVAVVFTIAPS